MGGDRARARAPHRGPHVLLRGRHDARTPLRGSQVFERRDVPEAWAPEFRDAPSDVVALVRALTASAPAARPDLAFVAERFDVLLSRVA